VGTIGYRLVTYCYDLIDPMYSPFHEKQPGQHAAFTSQADDARLLAAAEHQLEAQGQPDK
jgi:hypothetical protein